MKPIFDTCTPRTDVLSGELTEAMFAAKLRSVIEGTADAGYQDPDLFLANTFPTEGLKTLIREVFGRLSGGDPTASPFIRLETAFGGGKTHNLIALYHLARRAASDPPADLVPPALIPDRAYLTAGVVGSDLDPANGLDRGDVRTWTLWGEIAYQLGRGRGDPRTAYDVVRASDEQRVAPGTQVLEKLVAGEPALILLDEIARHLRAAQELKIPGGRGTLADQTVAFLMTLIEFAASQPRVSLVLTLADQVDAFSQQTQVIQRALREAQAVAARQERVIVPTGEMEISRIVTHRLFQEVDAEAARETASKYLDFFRGLEERGTELPDRAMRSDYADEMVTDYPFHPELLRTLSRKTATIPSFNRTRGALRLLARVVRRLWDAKPEETHLIAIHHLDLANEEILNDLTSRLDRPAFRNVAEADIASPLKGSQSKSQVLDRGLVEAGKPPYARRVATNIFLHSLTQGIATGADLAEIMVSVLEPGDDPQLIRKALGMMLAEEKGPPGSAFWFLHWDGTRYRFKTEPSLEKVIQDEIPHVGRVAARKEADERIRKIWQRGHLRPVFFASEAADLDDDAQEPKLALVHYDAASVEGSAQTPPDLVRKLFNHAGSMQGYRTYKNNVLFLVADKDQVDRMVDVVQRHLAIKRLTGSADRLAQFSEEQRRKLNKMAEASELEVRVAITRAYRHLFYPSSDAPATSEGLAHHLLPPQDQGEVSSDQTGVVLRLLKGLQKVLTADDPEVPAAFVRAKAWPHGQDSVSTLDLRREFAKRLALKMLLDQNQLKKTIRRGCQQRQWVYFDPMEQLGYGPDSPSPMVELSDQALLYTPEEAKRVGLHLKGEGGLEVCPLCKQDPCVCPVTPLCGVCGKDPCQCERPPLRCRESGAPGQVFQKIADRFRDEGATHIGHMSIRREGPGKQGAEEARALGLAIPQLGKAKIRVEQSFSASFNNDRAEDYLTLHFKGGKDRYLRVKPLTDSFGQEASEVNVGMTLSLSYPERLSVESDLFASLRDIFTSLELGLLIVDVEEAPEPKEEDQ